MVALVAGRFAQVESCRRARMYVLGLLLGAERKNSWTIAEQAGDLNPDASWSTVCASRGAIPWRPCNGLPSVVMPSDASPPLMMTGRKVMPAGCVTAP